MNKTRILALCGGVGGAKLALGLSKVLPADELGIVVNTGDDFEHLGLHISPDIDTVCYTLAGLNDTEKGWGLRNESWNFMARQEQLGLENWFLLGDKDLATHVFRTQALRQALTLSEITLELARRNGIEHPIIPMSDESVCTKIHTQDGQQLDFQEYFVKHRCEPAVQSIEFAGIETAKASEAFQKLLNSEQLERIIICPSNPYLSIDPIIKIPGVKDMIRNSRATTIVVSPIISGKAVKGPTAKIMTELGITLSNLSIAHYYQDIMDTLVIDEADADEQEAIQALGLNCFLSKTLMNNDKDKIALAEKILFT